MEQDGHPPEQRRIIMALWDQLALLLELLLERLERMLLRDGQVAQPSREGLVVGVRDSLRHGARARLLW